MFENYLVDIAGRLDDFAFYVISAVVIGLFSWYFARTIGNKVTEMLTNTKLDLAIKHLGWDEKISRLYAGGSMVAIFGKTVEIWILLLFAMVCSSILGLTQLSLIFNRVWEYFINIFSRF